MVQWCGSPSRNAGESGAGRDDRIAVHSEVTPNAKTNVNPALVSTGVSV